MRGKWKHPWQRATAPGSTGTSTAVHPDTRVNVHIVASGSGASLTHHVSLSRTMDLIKDLLFSFAKLLTKNDPHHRTIKVNRNVLRLSPRVVRFILSLTAQCRVSQRSHYKRIQRGSVKGVWFGDDATSRSEEQLAGGSGPVILYIHGGAFISGQSKMWSGWAIDLVANHKKKFNKNLAIFCVDYSLAPDAHFPVQWHQCRTAVDYMLRSLAIHPARLYIAGDSAGGNLALQTMFELETSKNLAGAILFSPWVLPAKTLALRGLVSDTDNIKPEGDASWFVNADNDYVTEEFGGQGLVAYIGASMSFQNAYESAQINPHLRTAEEFAALPDMLVVYGQGEVLRDEIVGFNKKAEEHCHSVDVFEGPNGVHDWALGKELSVDPATYHKGIELVSDWVEKKMIHA